MQINTENCRVHTVDFCVIGGGIAGLAAAVSAARHGAKVLLMHDRPVLGGNSSSEIRMWIRGAHGKDNREAGILEEIALENAYRNPYKNYSVWDSILYEMVRFEPNIELLLNCSCNSVKMNGSKIESITGWQLTTYQWHTVYAGIFADCSGDSILAPLTGAEFRVGREAESEFDESIAPKTADKKTMGLSCLLQAIETDSPVPFISPKWANIYETDEDLPNRDHGFDDRQNYWWFEIGGTQNSIDDTESIRDELLKIAFGIWDHIKNRGDHKADNWMLEWVGFLPGKRESRRYVGDYILTQNDVRAEGKFDDLVAYGGWSMDDHHPEGIKYKGNPTIFHPAPSPYGIPYRCLFSVNIENLMFAGRNISVTHSALSSTRVMGTCGIIGQAVGIAAAIAVKNSIAPRDVYNSKLKELQQALMEDDCYLPWNKRDISEISRTATLSSEDGNAEALRSGIDRPLKDTDNGFSCSVGSNITYTFKNIVPISQIRIIFDSDLNRLTCEGHPVLRDYTMICNRFSKIKPFGFPKTMTKAFKLEYLNEQGNWTLLVSEQNHYQRLYKLLVHISAKAVRLIPIETWGNQKAHILSFDVK